MKSTYLGWHVLHVKSRHEKKIDTLLKESGLNSFLPIVSSIHQWSDRKKKIQQPLFPSYVFINTGSKHDFFKALTVRGVLKYLSFGNEYAKVKTEEIDKIKQLLSLEGVSDISLIGNHEIPKKGDQMMIKSGTLKGLECTVLKAKNKNKIFVRIRSIRQNIIAHVPLEVLISKN